MREILDTLFVIFIIKMIFAAPASLIILSLQFSIALLVLSALGFAKTGIIGLFRGVWSRL